MPIDLNRDISSLPMENLYIIIIIIINTLEEEDEEDISS